MSAEPYNLSAFSTDFSRLACRSLWSVTFLERCFINFVAAYTRAHTRTHARTQLSRRLDSNARTTREEVDVLRSALDSVPRLVDVQVSPSQNFKYFRGIQRVQEAAPLRQKTGKSDAYR